MVYKWRQVLTQSFINKMVGAAEFIVLAILGSCNGYLHQEGYNLPAFPLAYLQPATWEHELPTNEFKVEHRTYFKDTQEPDLLAHPRTFVPYMKWLSALNKGISLELDMSGLRVGRNGEIIPKKGSRSHPQHGLDVVVAHPQTLSHYLKVLSSIQKGVKVDFDVKGFDDVVGRRLRAGNQSQSEDEVPTDGPLKTILLKYTKQD